MVGEAISGLGAERPQWPVQGLCEGPFPSKIEGTCGTATGVCRFLRVFGLPIPGYQGRRMRGLPGSQNPVYEAAYRPRLAG